MKKTIEIVFDEKENEGIILKNTDEEAIAILIIDGIERKIQYLEFCEAFETLYNADKTLN